MKTKKETRIVNIKNEPCEVYIGRKGKGKNGYFGNPFYMRTEEERTHVIEKFRFYFYNRLKTDAEFRQRIHALKGKTLGCFCKPNPCHGDVIKEYLDSID